MDDGATPGRGAPLSTKVDYLFRKVHPKGRGPYSYAEVATRIDEAGGPKVSASYIWQLRTGQRDNPTKRHLEALAAFFGVSPAYFFDDETSEKIAAELELLASMRDSQVRNVALRSRGLSPETLSTIQSFIERARELEGLSEDDSDKLPENGRPEAGR